MTEGFNYHANRISAWESRILPQPYRHPRVRLERAMEEVTELQEAVTVFDGSKEAKKNVAEEATDVVIRMLGLIVQVGGDPSALLSVKVDEMHAKYPPGEIQALYKQGLDYPTAMATQKSRWKRH